MKKILIVALIMLTTIFTLTSCAGYNSLTEQEAYDFGYGIGKMIRNSR